MALSRVVYALYQWLVLAVLARFGSTKMLGEYTFALALISPIIIFFQLNLRAFIATDANDQYSIIEYIATRTFTVIISLLFIIFISFFFSHSSEDALKIIFLVAIFKSVESISDICYGVFQKQEIMSRIAFSVILKSIFGFLGMLFCILIYQNIIYGAGLLAISWLIILFFYDLRKIDISISEVFDVKFSIVKKIIMTCLPLGIVVTLVNLRINIPIYFIERYYGVEEVGGFSVVSYFIVAGGLVVGSLSQAIAPKLAKGYFSEGIKVFSKMLLKLTFIAFCIGLLGILISLFFGRQILILLYGESFAELNILFFWLMLAGSVGYLSQFLGVALTVVREFKAQLYSSILGLIILIGMSVYFIPIFGREGAAISILGVNVAVFLFNLLYLKSFLKKSDINF